MSKFDYIRLGFEYVRLYSIEFDYGSITIRLSFFFFFLMICNLGTYQINQQNSLRLPLRLRNLKFVTYYYRRNFYRFKVNAT